MCTQTPYTQTHILHTKSKSKKKRKQNKNFFIGENFVSDSKVIEDQRKGSYIDLYHKSCNQNENNFWIMNNRFCTPKIMLAIFYR